MNPLSISEVARNAGVTIQAVSIALDDERLTLVEIIGRRAVKPDRKYDTFLTSTRNRGPKGKSPRIKSELNGRKKR